MNSTEHLAAIEHIACGMLDQPGVDHSGLYTILGLAQGTVDPAVARARFDEERRTPLSVLAARTDRGVGLARILPAPDAGLVPVAAFSSSI